MRNKDFGFLKKPTKQNESTFTLISDGSCVYAIQGDISKTFHDSLGIEFALELPAGFFKALALKPAMDMSFELLESGDLRLSFPAYPALQFDVIAKPARIEKPADVKTPIEQTAINPTASLHLNKLECACLETARYKKKDKDGFSGVGFETPIDPKAINAKAKLPSRGFPPAVKEYIESKKTTVIKPDGHIEKPAESKPITVISAKDGRAYTGRVATKLIEHMTNRGYTDSTFGTYPQWIKQGRVVMKGQKGLRIETESYSFTVFNKEQTMEVSK